MSIKERIRDVINAQNMTVKGFSEVMDIPLRTLHNYLSGQREPSAEFLIQLLSRLDINLNWLLISEGEIYISKIKVTDLTQDESDLLEKYRLSNGFGKRFIIKTSIFISKELEYDKKIHG